MPNIPNHDFNLETVLSDECTISDFHRIPGILADKDIKTLQEQQGSFITPFVSHQVRHDDKGEAVMSYGLDSMFYDIRLGSKYKVLVSPDYFDNLKEVIDAPWRAGFFTRSNRKSNREPYVLDPKFQCKYVEYMKEDFIIIPPHGFILAHSVEFFEMPTDVTGFLFCKSSYARVGINMAPTTLKPGWKGQLVLELFNQTNIPVKMYVNEGIGSIAFMRSEESPDVGYDGVYNGQEGVTTSKVGQE